MNGLFLRYIAPSPIILSIISVFILVIGLWLDIYGIKESFPRSGSLLVCFSLYCVYINHFLSNAINKGNKTVKTILGVGKTENEFQKNINSEIKGEEIRKRTASSFIRFKDYTIDWVENLESVRSNIIKFEFVAGISGTFIWGFGEILTNIIHKVC